MLEKHNVSGWAKDQNNIVVSMKAQHLVEITSNKDCIDSLRRGNILLQSNLGKCKRNLQSYQQRCSLLEQLVGSKENEHKNSLIKSSQNKMEAESQLEKSLLVEKELKSKVSVLEGNIASLHNVSAERKSRDNKIVEGLKTESLSLREQIQVLSSRIIHLEDEQEKARQFHDDEKQKMQQVTAHTVREINMECESLRAANESRRLKTKEIEELREKQTILNQSNIDQLVSEKKQLTVKMEKWLSDERDAVENLMLKVQEHMVSKQKLTTENFLMTQQARKHIDQIATLQKIICGGELKLSHLGKQLARSICHQETLIIKESEMRKELTKARLELERSQTNKLIISHQIVPKPLLQSENINGPLRISK